MGGVEVNDPKKDFLNDSDGWGRMVALAGMILLVVGLIIMIVRAFA